jgi:hypothetical protein
MADPMPLMFIELDFKDNVALRPPKDFADAWKAFEYSLWNPRIDGKYYTFNWTYDTHHPNTVHVIIGK